MYDRDWVHYHSIFCQGRVRYKKKAFKGLNEWSDANIQLQNFISTQKSPLLFRKTVSQQSFNRNVVLHIFFWIINVILWAVINQFQNC